jgi:hypothetical protein
MTRQDRTGQDVDYERSGWVDWMAWVVVEGWKEGNVFAGREGMLSTRAGVGRSLHYEKRERIPGKI